MLTKEQNEILCRVGPGTPMGKLMRQYWIPALLSSEVPRPDGDPLRVRLLGEDLIAFRDTHGNVGLIQNNCPHRGASLVLRSQRGRRTALRLSRLEVRCHGAVRRHAQRAGRERLQAESHGNRVSLCGAGRDRLGVHGAMPTSRPRFPAFEALGLDPDHIRHGRRYQEENYAQALEGGIDSAHASFLHSSITPPATGSGGLLDMARRRSRSAQLSRGATVERTADRRAPRAAGRQRLLADQPVPDAVLHAVAWRRARPRQCLGADGRRDARCEFRWRGIQIWRSPTKDSPKPRAGQAAGKPCRAASSPRATCCRRPRSRVAPGAPRPTRPTITCSIASCSAPTLLGCRRRQHRNGGPVGPGEHGTRSSIAPCEHLGTTDVGIIQTRRLLDRFGAGAARERRTPPPGAREAQAYRIHATDFTLERGGDWIGEAHERMYKARQSPAR